ncbi:O-methyltransferase [Corynebacterium sp. zg912]|uniref:O-methyltransferase n=1 Tax=Corynebacterium wankanglinii TaxID=2735136 RepID=A0A7H0KC16_9CORY|nr:O-methyltransferase [Corynebacterium wankanglinii]MCR5928897.1 O-methyltransferase [Corynebacterium sp. zg912]QNP94832.1 class I SAM-dependent methyltransferase [Corynebacterium wankanglinii]
MIARVSETAFSQLSTYITARRDHIPEAVADALRQAREDAEENGVPTPSPIVGDLLTVLAAGSQASQGAVAVTPAAGVAGLHILVGLREKATLTCIEPEAALQAGAKEAFRAAGFAPSRVRFLTSRPLEVMGRLATGAYQLIYADVAAVQLRPLIDAAWPLLAPGGTLVIAGSLLDGTVADPTRRDRETEAAREADAFVDTLALDDAAVARLPLDGGLTLITKRG